MGRRYRIKGHYVERDRHGRFKRWTSVGRLIAADRRKKAIHRPKKRGHGHEGDYEKALRDLIGA